MDKRYSPKKALNQCCIEGCTAERAQSYSRCLEHQREYARGAVSRYRARLRARRDEDDKQWRMDG